MYTETYEAITADDRDGVDDPVPPMLARSLDAFRRDLPRLLETHYGKWVVYQGDAQLGFGKTETELYEKCLARGMKRDEFLVCSIELEIPDDEITWSYGS
jgi:hypothetical protein